MRYDLLVDFKLGWRKHTCDTGGCLTVLVDTLSPGGGNSRVAVIMRAWRVRYSRAVGILPCLFISSASTFASEVQQLYPSHSPPFLQLQGLYTNQPTSADLVLSLHSVFLTNCCSKTDLHGRVHLSSHLYQSVLFCSVRFSTSSPSSPSSTDIISSTDSALPGKLYTSCNATSHDQNPLIGCAT